MDDTRARAEDSALVTAFQAGDPSAFEIIVRRHYASLLGVADRRCGGGALAEDVVQTALVRAHRYMQRSGAIQNLGGWLHRLVQNCATDLLRIERRRLSGTQLEEGLEASGTDSRERVERAELRELILGGIERLPDIYREPLRMRYLMGLDARDIAEQLSDNLHSVKSRLARGRRELRRRLESRLERAGYL